MWSNNGSKVAPTWELNSTHLELNSTHPVELNSTHLELNSTHLGSKRGTIVHLYLVHHIVHQDLEVHLKVHLLSTCFSFRKTKAVFSIFQDRQTIKAKASLTALAIGGSL